MEAEKGDTSEQQAAEGLMSRQVAAYLGWNSVPYAKTVG